jgi:hypothetical protein
MRRAAVVVAMLAAVGNACGSASPPATPTVAAMALVVSDDGLAGVAVGTSARTWVVRGAVAAPDGSAVFMARATRGAGGGRRFEVVHIDARTGEGSVVGSVDGPSDLHVAAVHPGGDRVALAGREGERTRILDFRPASGTVEVEQAFDGVLEPEAYATDGARMYGARIYGDRYHVHVLDLATGEQYPTFGPDKTQTPEDMYGNVVQAVLSPDGGQLATLYRDAVKPDHTAFVHLLTLESGVTVCIDLHAPFGTGEISDDTIGWDDQTVVVGHRTATSTSTSTATFDVRSLTSEPPRRHYHADVTGGLTAPALPEGVAGVAGFRRFVSLVP